MPLLVTIIIGALVNSLGTMVGRILASLGMGYMTYTGVMLVMDWVKDGISSNMGSLPVEVLQILGTLRAGEGVSILLSGLAVRMAFDGMTSDRFKRLTQGA